MIEVDVASALLSIAVTVTGHESTDERIVPLPPVAVAKI